MLLWAPGDGFVVDEKPELDDETVRERMLTFIRQNPGTGWTKVEEATPGLGTTARMKIRDGLLRDGQIVNVGKDGDGHEVAFAELFEGKRARLYVADDPTIAYLTPEPGAVQGRLALTAPAAVQRRGSVVGAGDETQPPPAPLPLEGAGWAGAVQSPTEPPLEGTATESPGAVAEPTAYADLSPEEQARLDYFESTYGDDPFTDDWKEEA